MTPPRYADERDLGAGSLFRRYDPDIKRDRGARSPRREVA